MSSQINPSSIDGTYPVAGQDNNSQGFRNNFTNVKNNLGVAKNEIEDLQVKALLKAPLEGGLLNNDFNDLNDSPLVAARLRNIRETVYDLGTSLTPTIDFNNGSFQFLTTSGNTTISFTGWPSITPRYARLRLLVSVDATSRILSLDTSTASYSNTSALPGYLNNNAITLKANSLYLFEFSTYDSGLNVYVNELFKSAVNAVEYQYSNLANVANAVTVSSTVSTLVIDAPNYLTTVPTANITLPANVDLYDGQSLTISSNLSVTINACNINANGSTIRGSQYRTANFGPFSSNTWIYSKPLGSWFSA